MSQSLSSAVVVILALRVNFPIANVLKWNIPGVDLDKYTIVNNKITAEDSLIGPRLKKIDHVRNVSNANNRYTLWA